MNRCLLVTRSCWVHSTSDFRLQRLRKCSMSIGKAAWHYPMSPGMTPLKRLGATFRSNDCHGPIPGRRSSRRITCSSLPSARIFSCAVPRNLGCGAGKRGQNRREQRPRHPRSRSVPQRAMRRDQAVLTLLAPPRLVVMGVQTRPAWRSARNAAACPQTPRQFRHQRRNHDRRRRRRIACRRPRRK